MGISIDSVRNIITASKEWWDEKIQDTVAVGDKAKVPCEFYDSSTLDDVQFVDITDGKDATDEVLLFDDVDPFLTYDSSRALTPQDKPHTHQRKKIAWQLPTFPGFEEGLIGYLEELEVFLKKPARQNFMVPKTNETKMEFLKRLIEKKK
ncbi:unnamed protein product [Lactuca saligna]|uniref:Uncharacterized protein n=1 Tax=Lactuca saligna TaxID=75948 RepID=A0AA35VID9_LACSI|nr:unnamed protein product [Lactuca saligna]